jgi:PIN domain nuclease of toxin-antitoxin system
VKLLLDTQIILWAAGEPRRLSTTTRKLLLDARNELLFSAASLWEIAIKASIGRADFQVERSVLRRGLLDNGYTELPVTSQHAVLMHGLPDLHRDSFHRLLLAQAICEGITLVTADAQLARYAAPFRKVEQTNVEPATHRDSVRLAEWINTRNDQRTTLRPLRYARTPSFRSFSKKSASLRPNARMRSSIIDASPLHG